MRVSHRRATEWQPPSKDADLAFEAELPPPSGRKKKKKKKRRR